MTEKKLPNSKLIYVFALLSCILFCFGGIAIIFPIIALVAARKSEKIFAKNPDDYSNINQIKKGKIIAIIGLVLNAIIIGITIWTLATIGWDAWSEEFMLRWNEGMQNNGR
jgi:amino acid permease